MTSVLPKGLADTTRSDGSRRRPRIALINPSAGANSSGGAEVFAVEMAKHLSDFFSVQLLAGGDCGDFCVPAGGIPRNKLYNFVQNPLVQKTLGRVSTHPAIVLEHLTNFLPCATRLLLDPPDLIFPCNDYGGLAIASFVRKISGTPFLFTEHGSLMSEGLLLRRNLKFAPDHLVVFAEEVREAVKAQSPEQSVNIIPNGVDLERFQDTGDTLDFSELESPIVVCVAFLERAGHKRVELAIQAMAKLGRGSLLVCGDGTDRDYYQKMGSSLLGNSRFSIRTFKNTEMPAVYRSADLFTLPSIAEPCALSYLEAMACNLPVVTTDDTMRRSTVQDAGIVCDVTDTDSYSQALESALSRDWGKIPRTNALRFSWSSIALQYREIILNLLEKQ